MKYDLVSNYAMKCRLYPTESQKKAIDDALMAVKVFHNCLVFDMWHQGINVREKADKDKNGVLTGKLIHYPDLSAALKATYKKQLIKDHPIISACPQAALTTEAGLKADLKKEFGLLPIEAHHPRYYNDLHPRRSYSYQETLSKIQCKENRKVFTINLALIGLVKVRGWNQKLRFGDSDTDFLQWVTRNPKEKITVVISKDAAEEYHIVFKIKECLKPFPEAPASKVGVDVGISDIAVCSDGVKYENKKFKKQEKRHQKLLNRRMSRRWGPSNEVYREARKKNLEKRKKCMEQPEVYGEIPPIIQPSKQYLKCKKKHAVLSRKISRKRELWNHIISRRLVEGNSLVALETLNIKGMFHNRHLSYALTDAAFGTLLQTIKYKAEWHKRTVLTIDQWTPSSKRCCECGYIYQSGDRYGLKPWNLNIRNWECPVCGTRHDRDVNAAKNILFYAEKQHAG